MNQASFSRERSRRRPSDDRRYRSDLPDIAWPRLAVPAAMLIAVILLGGSTQIAMPVLFGQVAAILALVAFCTFADATRWRAAVPVLVMALAMLAVAAIQLVPLSAATWQGLPGRAAAAAIMHAAGLGDHAHALSLAPEATIACLLATLPGLAFALATIGEGKREVSLLFTIVIALAFASELLGVLQVGGGQAFYLYPFTHFGAPVGLFANRNHQADLLLIAMLLLAGRPAADDAMSTGRRRLAIALAAFLAFGVLTTGSRVGIAILPFAIVAALLLQIGRGGTRLWSLFAIVVVLAIGAGALVAFNPTVHGLLSRFNSISTDNRHVFWADTSFAIGQYWPAGSGLGTFVPVYTSIEALDTMPQNYVNHAHDDYLEILLETGIVGAVMMVGYAIALIVALLRGLRGGVERAAAALALLVLLVHSTADFPLRTPALMAVFGLLNGFLFAPAVSSWAGSSESVPQ